MDIFLLGFLALIIIILFCIKKPSRQMLSAENLADDLTGMSTRRAYVNKERHIAKALTSISASMKKSNANQNLANDRAKINNLIQDIK